MMDKEKIEELEELEELEKQFIVKEDIEEKMIKYLVSRVSKMCRIDTQGFVMIFHENLKLKDKILLVLAARYLANRLQQKLNKETTINDEVGAGELSKILKEKNNIIRARITELKKEGKVTQVRRGVYKIMPHIIEDFLNELEGENSVE